VTRYPRFFQWISTFSKFFWSATGTHPIFSKKVQICSDFALISIAYFSIYLYEENTKRKIKTAMTQVGHHITNAITSILIGPSAEKVKRLKKNNRSQMNEMIGLFFSESMTAKHLSKEQIDSL
jgi:hypothetical protein